MVLPIRNSVKVLLLNAQNELLLMYYHGRFWDPVGGEIEQGESVTQAALREIFEETGIRQENIELGPIVWFGEFDFDLGRGLTRNKQTFMVAKTNQSTVSMAYLTNEEKAVVKNLAWFSLEQIQHSSEIIYPTLLPEYLPDIVAGNYPQQPIEIDLAAKPKK